MRYCIVAISLILMSFTSRIVTPNPVLGFREIPFLDEFHLTNRSYLIWYPVDPFIEGKASESPWDTFLVAKEAIPKKSKNKMPVVILSHGYTGNPHQLS